MSDPNAYTMLMASLPLHGALFAAKQTPLSRLKLERRLRVLTPEDRESLRLVEDLLRWDRLSMALSEAEFVARARKTMALIENETLRGIIRDRLELRTCVAALRRRRRGEGPPRPGTSRDGAWGYSRWLGHIARNWREPAFRLEGVFPWLREAERLLRQGDARHLERLLLEQVWINLGRAANDHLFDFEAVVIYVLRWNVIERWTTHDGEAAKVRFAALVDAVLMDATLGEHARLQEEGAG